MPLALRLKSDFDVPIVLLVEFAHNGLFLLGRRRYYLGLECLAQPLARIYWRWLYSMSAAIITSNPADRQHLIALALGKKPVYFVGWCNQKPEGAGHSSIVKNKERGIHVGSLNKNTFKNCEELLITVPLILENTPTREFLIVGNGTLAPEIESMARQWPGRIVYIKELPRKDVWELLAGSFYAYTPVKFGGWGFIGDAWAAHTPLVATHNQYGFEHGKDAVLAPDPLSIHKTVNSLYDNGALYRNLQENGFTRYDTCHSAEQVAKAYLAIFQKSLEKN